MSGACTDESHQQPPPAHLLKTMPERIVFLIDTCHEMLSPFEKDGAQSRLAVVKEGMRSAVDCMTYVGHE
jgi:hypothetical protein